MFWKVSLLQSDWRREEFMKDGREAKHSFSLFPFSILQSHMGWRQAGKRTNNLTPESRALSNTKMKTSSIHKRGKGRGDKEGVWIISSAEHNARCWQQNEIKLDSDRGNTFNDNGLIKSPIMHKSYIFTVNQADYFFICKQSTDLRVIILEDKQVMNICQQRRTFFF